VKKRLSLLIMVALLLGSVTTGYAASKADDITGITLEAEMREMIALEIITGYGEGVYRPHQNVTRGQFATFISRALKLPKGTGNFPDVPSSSSLAPGIYNANAAGIVTGYSNGKFGIDDQITREQMALMIDRALEYLEIERTMGSLEFTDINEINSSVFKIAVAHNTFYEIIRGIPNKDTDTFRFEPKSPATRAQAAAFISRMLSVLAEKQPELAFQVAAVSASGLESIPKKYASFETASAAITDPVNQVVVQGSKVIQMKEGLAIAKPSPGSYLTIIHNEGFKTQLTYVSPNTEMKYISSTANSVKVQIGNTIGYVLASEVWLTPKQMISGQSYYQVKGGDLFHYIYTGTSYVAYANNEPYGKAPSFLEEGKKYYSWDGETFLNASGKEVGTAYQYFNVLPVRTKSNYSAEELNAYVAAQRPTSPLKDLGASFKKAEETYGINALYLLSKAIHESAWGTSTIAKEKKNLFGIKAYDKDPLASATTFATFEECIMYLARYISEAYANPTGAHFNGAVLGDKSIGMNVKYASDPYWGQKISAYMYRIDKHLGGKDSFVYTLGVTNTSGLNVRSGPSTSDARQFTYKNAGNPVVILENEIVVGTDKWVKVVSDSPTHTEGYIFGPYVDQLPIAR
jgi:beta-N-acetylglucosaminidase